MFGLPPQVFNQKGQFTQQGLNQLAQGQTQFGLSGGPNDVVGPQGITPRPLEMEWCFAYIDDVEDNRHAWTEANLSDPDNPRRMEGGRFGILGGSGSGSYGDRWAAYDLNGNAYNLDDIVFIIRITWNAWGIIGGTGSGSGSGTGQYSFDCDTGLITRV